MTTKQICFQILVIVLIIFGPAANAATVPHCSAKPPFAQKKMSVAADTLTPQEYYDSMSRICDYMYAIKRALSNKLASYKTTDKWADIVLLRLELNGYCEEMMAGIFKKHGVGEYGRFENSVLRLMMDFLSIEQQPISLDGVDDGISEIRIQAFKDAMQQNLEDEQIDYKKYLVQRFIYGLQYKLKK